MMPIAFCLILGLRPALEAQADPTVVADAHQLRFHSDMWMNLHHTLYAAAWARRPEAGTLRALAGGLPAALPVDGLTPEERKAWTDAVDYYDRQLAARDLLFDERMDAIKSALAAGDLSRPSIGSDLRAVLQAAGPVYRGRFWPEHDRANRAWIAAAVERIRVIGAPTIARLAHVYETTWFTSPVRVDVVWVGNRQGAYTTTTPPHAVLSSGDRELTGWTSAEIVFHEVSHVLVAKVSRAINTALGDRRREDGQLWHVVQFYLTGAVVQEALRSRGIDYEPYMYATGLLDRAWGRYRKPVEENWKPYLDGRVSLDEAVSRTVAAVGGGPHE